MSDPEKKRQKRRVIQRNFIAKKLRTQQFKKKIHIDAKTKAKEKTWRPSDEEEG